MARRSGVGGTVTGMQQTRAAPPATLDAVLERITYANEETGYTVARVATDRSSDLLTRLSTQTIGRNLRAWSQGGGWIVTMVTWRNRHVAVERPNHDLVAIGLSSDTSAGCYRVS